MRIHMHNIGKIHKADIITDGITVIVGGNDTGKSTIGRSLFMYCESLRGIDTYIELDRINNVSQKLKASSETFDLYCKNISNSKRRKKVEAVKDLRSKYAVKIVSEGPERIRELLNSYCLEHASFYKLATTDDDISIYIEKWISDTEKSVNASFETSDNDLGKRRVTEAIDQYFDSQIIRIVDDVEESEEFSYIEVFDDNISEANKIEFKRNKKAGKDVCSNLERRFAVSLPAVYIENPRILDTIQLLTLNKELISYYLKDLLTPEPNLHHMVYRHKNPKTYAFKKHYESMDDDNTAIQREQQERLLEDLEEKISTIVGGRIEFNTPKGLVFKIDNKPRTIEISNLSTGIKSLSLLEFALEYGCIEEGSVLILDEPEINLHPEWQIKYAEVLIELQKLMNLHVVITTHSPYFMEALEYYAKSKGLRDKFHCYLAEYEYDISRISNVDKFPSLAYKKLIEPFTTLERIRNNIED